MAPEKHRRYILVQDIVSSHRVTPSHVVAHSGQVDMVLLTGGATASHRIVRGSTARVLHGVKTIISPIEAATFNLAHGNAGGCIHSVTGFSCGSRARYLTLEEPKRSKSAAEVVQESKSATKLVLSGQRFTHKGVDVVLPALAIACGESRILQAVGAKGRYDVTGEGGVSPLAAAWHLKSISPSLGRSAADSVSDLVNRIGRGYRR